MLIDLKSKNAQTAIEFIIMTSFLLVFFVGFMAVIGTDITKKREDIMFAKVQDLANEIQQELVLAGEASEGYHRTFSIPSKIGTVDYEILTEGNTLVIDTRKYSYFVETPLFSGTINKGTNKIKKESGLIQVN